MLDYAHAYSDLANLHHFQYFPSQLLPCLKGLVADFKWGSTEPSPAQVQEQEQKKELHLNMHANTK